VQSVCLCVCRKVRTEKTDLLSGGGHLLLR
jgi:hypothetical protein